MSWSTELFCNISFSRETYNDKFEVEDRIKELEKLIQIVKNGIRDLVIMTEPSKYCPNDYEPICWVVNTFNDSIELMEEYTIELYKLNLLLDNWDECHDINGLAINPPENITYKSAYLSGDFINCINNE